MPTTTKEPCARPSSCERSATSPREEEAAACRTGHDDEDETPGVAQSGLDEDGALRCGVREAKMKLTRKKRAE